MDGTFQGIEPEFERPNRSAGQKNSAGNRGQALLGKPELRGFSKACRGAVAFLLARFCPCSYHEWGLAVLLDRTLRLRESQILPTFQPDFPRR
jgi:hypothetical protein